jgi:hypothetical protein
MNYRKEKRGKYDLQIKYIDRFHVLFFNIHTYCRYICLTIQQLNNTCTVITIQFANAQVCVTKKFQAKNWKQITSSVYVPYEFF